MKISPLTLPNVAAARQTMPPEPSVTAPRNERAAAVKPDPTEVRKASPVFSSTLSPATNWQLTQMAQEDNPASERAGKSPAQAARALIGERPDLADRPFGSVVSMLARGQAIPVAINAPPVEVVADVAPLDGEAPAEDGVGPVLTEAPAVDEPDPEVNLVSLTPDQETQENTPDLADLIVKAGFIAPQADVSELLDQV